MKKWKLCPLLLYALCTGLGLCAYAGPDRETQSAGLLSAERIDLALGSWTKSTGDVFYYVGVHEIDAEAGTVTCEATLLDRGVKTVILPYGTLRYRIVGDSELLWNPDAPVSLRWDAAAGAWRLHWKDQVLERHVPELAYTGDSSAGAALPPE